jgi:hypothetical protein
MRVALSGIGKAFQVSVEGGGSLRMLAFKICLCMHVAEIVNE